MGLVYHHTTKYCWRLFAEYVDEDDDDTSCSSCSTKRFNSSTLTFIFEILPSISGRKLSALRLSVVLSQIENVAKLLLHNCPYKSLMYEKDVSEKLGAENETSQNLTEGTTNESNKKEQREEATKDPSNAS